MDAKEVTAAIRKQIEMRSSGWSYASALRCMVLLKDQQLFSLPQARRLLHAIEWMAIYLDCDESFLINTDLTYDTKEADLRQIWEEVKDMYL